MVAGRFVSYHRVSTPTAGSLRPRLASSAFDLNELVQQFPLSAVEIIRDRLLLSFEAEAGATLLLGGNSMIRNEPAGDHRYSFISMRYDRSVVTRAICQLPFLPSKSIMGGRRTEII